MMRQPNDAKSVFISIKGLPVYSVDDNDAFELMTDGEYFHTDNVSTLTYEETSLTGANGMHTIFDIEPNRIVLRRDDGLTGDMIFDEQQKHHFLYATPFGSIMMGIDTHSITKCMSEDGGNLEIRYDIEVDNVAVSQNLFKLNIKSLPQ
ncbi:MAG: DUF1934 domain-containing protein [Oscillospiraceae bacterium]|nr:DUF1934 domain-containing protein [Oscillospiraceae bacterium]MCL2278455.1 DUF1934 domain-containing protein [Oscillospiraceae bacterium]